MLRSAQFGCPNAPHVKLVQGPPRFQFRRRLSPAPIPILRAACGVAAEDVPHEEFFDVLRLDVGPLHRPFAERSTPKTSTKGPQKPPNGVLALLARWVFLSIAVIAKRVLFDSNNYFTAGPKRSTSSFHEAMILALVFRALRTLTRRALSELSIRSCTRRCASVTEVAW